MRRVDLADRRWSRSWSGVAFLPARASRPGSRWPHAITFAIGLIVANVPEGLLPTITLALAVGVRGARPPGRAWSNGCRAVETLGSTTVICTDKTGTLTENRMRVTRLWLPGSGVDATRAPAIDDPRRGAARRRRPRRARRPRRRATRNQPAPATRPSSRCCASPTDLGVAVAPADGTPASGLFHFDPTSSGCRPSTTDDRDRRRPHQGRARDVLPCCYALLGPDGHRCRSTTRPASSCSRHWTGTRPAGLRVLAVARRAVDPGQPCPSTARGVEPDLTLLGLVAMVDPPRAAVADAVASAHRAGIRILVVTGDHGLTAAEIARQVGIGHDGGRIVTGAELDRLSDADLDALLAGDDEIVFARSSPEAKLRIGEALRAQGHVVAMTGDGVNDAPALRHADIGVAMGRSGTDVAREAATMVLTDDNFATIVAAVEAGRRVYDNVRKFILYIFAHAVPEVVPFLVFALSGGAVPLPLTVLQILAIDLGTETLPALALGREPAEPGLMDRPPRPRAAGVIDRALLLRAWLLLGGVSAVLVMGGFLFTLWRGRLAPRRPDRRRHAAAPRLPAGHHDDVPRHRRLPDRHRVRRPHRPRLAVHDRAVHQPAAAVGHRVRAGLRRRGHLPAAAAGHLRHRAAGPGAACS